MLQQESFFGSDDRLDVDLIQHILEILDEREPIVEEPDAELSYKVFKEEIIPQLKRKKPRQIRPPSPRSPQRRGEEA